MSTREFWQFLVYNFKSQVDSTIYDYYMYLHTLCTQKNKSKSKTKTLVAWQHLAAATRGARAGGSTCLRRPWCPVLCISDSLRRQPPALCCLPAPALSPFGFGCFHQHAGRLAAYLVPAGPELGVLVRNRSLHVCAGFSGFTRGCRGTWTD